MKTTRQRLFNLLNVFETVKDLQGVKFAYAVIKNKEKIKKEVITLNKYTQPTGEYQEWEKARITLCNKYCTKKDGKPVIENNKFVGLEKNSEFEKALEELKKEYKTTLDDYKAKVDEYNKKLTEEIEFDLHQIEKKELPEKISPKQLESILDMVKE